MASSTLDPDNNPESDRQLGIGHGVDALGPSDISDTGSDVQGGYRAIEDGDLGLDRGTNEDSDTHPIAPGNDTSDSGGTGEESTAGRNGDVRLDGDIGFDRIDRISSDNDPDADVFVDPALQAIANDDADANPDADIDALADLPDDDAEGEVPLFDKATRTDERTPPRASR